MKQDNKHPKKRKEEITVDARNKRLVYQGENYYDKILEFRNPDVTENLIKCINNYMQEKGGSISSSQLRNIFNLLKKITSKEKLVLSKPKLIYIAGRQNDNNTKEFVILVDKLLSDITENSQIEDFKLFLESIIAYHKFHHPKSN